MVMTKILHNLKFQNCQTQLVAQFYCKDHNNEIVTCILVYVLNKQYRSFTKIIKKIQRKVERLRRKGGTRICMIEVWRTLLTDRVFEAFFFHRRLLIFLSVMYMLYEI